MKALHRTKRRIQVLSAALWAFAVVMMVQTTALAAGTGTIKGNNVNVRSEAGVTGDKVTTLNNGDITVVEGTKKDADGKKWYRVSFTKNGTAYQGYISADYVTYQKTKKSSDGVTVIDASDAAQQAAQTTATGAAGETGAAAQTQEQVATEKATAQTTAKTKKATVTATNVNVRKKTVTGAVVGRVTRGDTIAAIRKKKASDGKIWYYISFTKGKTTKKGWIRSDFIQVESEETAAQEQTETDVLPAQLTDPAVKKYATVTATNVNVRRKTVSGAVVARLNQGERIGVIRSKKSTDKKRWYYITFLSGEKVKKGWIRGDLIKVEKKAAQAEEQSASQPEEVPTQNDDAVPELSAEEFETYLTTQAFPESYKASLRTLHATYPKWTFRAVQTGLKWTDVIAAESKTGLNLVSKGAAASWKSTQSTAYDWKKNVWYTFDGGKWAAASEGLIQYYMDPRNFLDETNIFQFESLEYENYQNTAGIQELLKNSFMSGNYTEPDGTVKSYADTFLEIGQFVGISPYHLAARCYQEQGKGTSDSISGTVEGYENIFNYYNIGAYASGKNSPTKQGLIYASSTGKTEDVNYDRPWNTRYKSLLGGAKYVASKYVKLRQNTLYFQKFNVVNTKNGLYKHQYMANVQAAVSEAVKMSKAYVDKNTELVFYIPVYTEMPETCCTRPVGNLNPNNYLSEITVTDQTLIPVFDGGIESYDLTVEAEVDQVEITATPVAQTSAVTGTGTIALLQGINIVQIQCTSESGETKVYTLHITRK